ncbi:BCL-6 corepressor, partial [Stegodyphus mimosarum]
MYYPPLFTSVRPFDPRTNPLEVPVGRENPLDLSVKTIRPSSETAAGGADADDLLMLDHRKLANLAASHSLSAMGRQLIDPTLFRLGYGADAAAVIPGLAPPFCYDRTTGVAVPTSLAGHQMMTSFLQQRERCLEQQHQQALYAARNSAVAQQQAAVAAAAAAYMDPTNIPLHLRNGLTQREAAAALAATRGLYAPTLPAPMMLPAFSLYTDDKGAFTSLRNAAGAAAAEKNFLNGTTVAPVLEAARYAEHFQRLREQHLQQHQATGKCSNACCTSSTLAGLGQTSVPCACCVQTPSQAALCARSPMGCATKEPASAATGKVCDFVQPGLTFLHRPTATTTAPSTTSAPSSSEIRLSVSSLCTTQTTTEPTTVSSSREKQNTSFRNSAIWNAGLPSVSPGGKTAFSVPKKKEPSNRDSSSHHSKEHRSSGSIKDILKDSQNNNSVSFETPKFDQPKVITSSSKHDATRKAHRDNPEKITVPVNEDFSTRYYQRDNADVKPFVFHKNPIVIPNKSNTSTFNINTSDAITTVTSVTPLVSTKCEGGTIPITKMPPLLEAVRPSEHQTSSDHALEPPTSVPSPQGPPPLIAVSSTTDMSSASAVVKSPYVSTESSSTLRTNSMYPNNSILIPSFKHQTEKPITEAPSGRLLSSKSPKKSSQSISKFNGLPQGFSSEEPQVSAVSLPKPIPHIPTHHLASSTPHHYASHYRPAQHQINLQNHNGWIPPANPNVTIAPLPQPVTTTSLTTSSTAVVTNAHRPTKTHQSNCPPSSQREPDYADTANVLQSLLIRSAPGLEPLATIPPSTVPIAATSVITPTNGLPLFGLDYFHLGQHLQLANGNRENMSTANHSGLQAAPNTIITTMPSFKEKTDILKTDNSHSSPVAPKVSSKKRSNGIPSSEENTVNKKRLLSSDFSSPLPRYSFQPTPFANEASEAPECPYTFIPEPPLNFSNQFKMEENQKHCRRECLEKPHDTSVDSSKSAITTKSPSKPSEPRCIPKITCEQSTLQTADRLSAIRAKRKLRKKLLARIYQQRRPLLTGHIAPDPSAIEKQLAVRYTRKLLSQLTLRWAHRRYLHKWHSMKRKNSNGVLKLRKKKKNGKVVYKIKRESDGKLKDSKMHESSTKTNDSPCSLAITPEMKRLMGNKALGETTLHRAARLGYPESVAYCLKTKCVSVNARDNAGYTPLHECCSRGHLDIARALLQYGADVNASAAGGIRPLHDAVENDHVEIVRLLLSYGADPTIATYSGLEPIKLARSPMMAEFLQGFLADISGEVDSRPHLPWRFWGSARCLDPDDSGYDVFDGVPSDPQSEGEGDNDFLFEVSDSPHLPTFRLLLPAANSKAQCNYLRLNDVLRKLSITKEEFLQLYGHIEILALPRHEFEASATCSPLLTGTKLDNPLMSRPNTDRLVDNGSTTDLVRLDNSIRQVLGIETISVR